MKHLIALAFITTCLFSFGQTNMFWNNYANFNPAMSGFEHEYHGAITAREDWKWNNGIEGLTANYNQRIAGNHGVGIAYSGIYYQNFFQNNVIKLNYNYQFDLKKAGKIATGIGVGYEHVLFDESFLSSFNPPPSFSRTVNFALVNIGVAYSWKKLNAGVSTTDYSFLLSNNDSISQSNKIGINLHASYDFQLSRKFQLTPRALFTAQNGFRDIAFDLTTTYLKKFSLGVMTTGRDNFGIHAGWDIREKFRVSYLISRVQSALTSSGPNHEFTLGFFLKEKAPIRTPFIGTPSF